MPKSKRTSDKVSKELSSFLDHLTGIPAGMDDAAIQLKVRVLGEEPPPDYQFGMWYGGCYYVRSKRGTVKGRTGTWRRVVCIV